MQKVGSPLACRKPSPRPLACDRLTLRHRRHPHAVVAVGSRDKSKAAALLEHWGLQDTATAYDSYAKVHVCRGGGAAGPDGSPPAPRRRWHLRLPSCLPACHPAILPACLPSGRMPPSLGH